MEFTLATLLPLLTLGALGWAIPAFTARLFEDTLPGLARALALSALLLILAGTALFLLLYSDIGLDPASLTRDPLGAARHFLGLGLKSALVWAPVLVLTAIALGQGVEARRERRMSARDPD